MKLCTTVQEMRQERAQLGRVGFVPTMGFLHEGHLSLVRRAREETDAVVVSLFVNPIQFGSADDLANYPRALERDIALLRREGVACVFTPEAAEFYPEGFATQVDVGGVALELEGPSRPGHFAGVATVLAKFFNIIQPQRVYFGQKDAQQCAVVQRFVRDLNIPVDIVTLPTWREADGLAGSSRNSRLTEAERHRAPVLHQALCRGRTLVQAGERRRAVLEGAMRDVLVQAGLVDIDYVTIVNPDTFQAEEEVREGALALLAVQLGAVRLIDNMPLF
ncbi:pantoate--beta-alanine ligase [Parasaccharibacter sp. TMW2.1882]|uniref:pantoate--beta-alanine ligase n=1 Tax=unclassified Parasaccharibacter TaxID=2626400 RepID=UPI001319884E|nr:MULTISPECIES: pantoate--beta-alanine ligase [unclassified Parasaccharibacter]MCK8636358.1 pantoate--beta-alanine ligase [Parasaccharibacter sp. TMW2.1885]MCL1496600.1 pantoate--beta-alanine ligase [Parasaccharibacter sp. TMW2.1882]MCL1510950.1 pantoate--beta-alanine ligase [Parasaccharibacter sp. TMW 2.1884]QGT74771.1 pantoate--beta-alanine ligase [Bombella sp. ESL0368]